MVGQRLFLLPDLPRPLARSGSSAIQTKKLEETKMKKHNIIRKFFAVTAACAMALSLTACSNGGNTDKSGTTSTAGSAPGTETVANKDKPLVWFNRQPSNSSTGEENTPAGVKSYKVAIIKQMDHASLDEIAAAVEARLDEIGAENGVTIEYTTTSGQGDQTILMQLADQAIADGVDAIIPIATTAAQVAAVSAEETKTPVVYAAISYPETADLTGIDYVTGTSDALDTQLILDMMLAQDPNVESVGLLYSLSEPNSEVPIAEAKAYLDEKGIAYTEQTANTNDEVVAAASALIAAGVDAIFTPTDNIIMAAELAIYEDLAAAGIPHYTGADSFVRNGAFAACGVNYTNLGAETANLAYQAITQGMDSMEEVYQMPGDTITVNTETAEALGADYSMFEGMAENLVTVTTTLD